MLARRAWLRLPHPSFERAMDLLLPLLFAIAAAFCWLLAVGEGGDAGSGGVRLRGGGRRYRYSPLRATAPGLLAAAAMSFGLEAARSGGYLLAAAAIVAALAAAAVALGRYRASVDYLPERGLRISDWSGRREIAFSDVVSAAYLPGGGWRPDNHRARLRLQLDDGSVITLSEHLRGFTDLLRRVADDCPEGLLETRPR